MNAVSRYDRLLISLAMAVLGAMALSGQARAQNGPQTLDRYGGEARGGTGPADPWAEAAVAAPAGFEGGALNWSGKSEAVPPARMAYAPPPPMTYAPPPTWDAPPPPPAWSSPVAHAAPSPAPKLYGVSPKRTSVAVLAAPARPSAPPLPASIYAPAPQNAELAPPTPPAASPLPPPPRVAVQGSGGQSVRHYSVHREFGITPDPTPIPPQFFTATADLSAQSAAEAEPLSRNPSTQTGSARTRARAAAAAPAADPS